MSSSEVLVQPTSGADHQYLSQSKIAVLIVHRDVNAAERLRAGLSGISDYEVVADCVSGVEAAEAVLRHQPDVLLLDVHVPKMEMLKGLLQGRHSTLVAYLVTEESPAFNQFTRTERKLVFTESETSKITEMAGRIKRQLSRGGRKRSRNLLSFFLGEPAVGQNQRFAFKYGRKLVVLNANDIVSVESDGRYSRIQTLAESYSLRYSLLELAERLGSELFYRVSSSALVNVNAIRELSCGWGADKFVILKDGRSLRVTKSYGNELKKIIDATWGLGRNDSDLRAV
jgi:two-component system, LytTR family, response regulator